MQRGLLAAVLLVAGAASAADVQGTLAANTTWTAAGGPYNLTGDVTVPAGVTLTVEPGAEVIAAASDALGAGADTLKVELIVRGTLRVRGTEATAATFRGATAGANQWYGVRVELGTTSILSGARVRDAVQGLEVTGAGTSATLSSSTLTGNVTGVSVTGGGTLAMDHTLVQGNRDFGAQIGAGTANFQYDTFDANGGYGLYIAQSSTSAKLTLQNSLVIGHTSYGLYAGAGTLTLSHNDVWNDTYWNYYGVSEGPHSFSANPLFVSSSNPRPTSRSPARKAASDGVSDIGALSYAGEATPFLAGTLHEDTTFSGNVLLQGDLTVAPGVTLTVMPGTTVTARRFLA